MIYNMDMDIRIDGDTIVVDGNVYRLDRSSSELWGRKEIAEYLGYRRADGTVNTSNMYCDCARVRILFPGCNMELAENSARPWTKKECVDWLTKPKSERMEIYLKSKESNNG